MTRPPQRRNRPRPRRSSADPARQAAYEVLEAVGVRDAYANLELPQVLARRHLAGRDAAFATELAFGTLRLRGLLDPVIASAAQRAMDRIDPPARDVLRLGAYQLLFLRVPPHAAVATSVTLAREAVPQAAGFVNAVLRRVAERDREAWTAAVAPDPEQDRYGYLSVAQSHPRWIVGVLADVLRQAPGGPAGLPDLLAVNNTPAPVTLAVRPGLAEVPDIREQCAGRPGKWSPYAVRLAGGDPGALPAVRDGSAGVQDEGSQLMVAALVRADVAGRDEHWLDLCAGPGGKAALLAALAAQHGARVTALEQHAHRADLVRSALRAIPGAHAVEQADATREGWEPAGADRVLVDVPCTGLGVLRRRPEARWRRTPSDIAALAPLQRGLLSAALDAVRPGGVVAYVTCSPHRAETELVVADVLRQRADVAVEPAAALLPEVGDAAAGDYARLWPHIHDTDGMFLAVLRRK
jgi:16S rRNA (cytosine967-C5)-methyltransferase